MIYEANSATERKILWRDLRAVKSIMGHVLWIVCGDFNIELSMHERSDSYDGMPCPPSVLDFRLCLDDVALTDMHHDGLFLTWSNNKTNGYLAKKLDRFLINES